MTDTNSPANPAQVTDADFSDYDAGLTRGFVAAGDTGRPLPGAVCVRWAVRDGGAKLMGWFREVAIFAAMAACAIFALPFIWVTAMWWTWHVLTFFGW